MKNLGNVFILGDSYSTFEGYIPEGYAVYYSPSADYTDVNRVEDTWWHMLISDTGSHLVQNNSWSGSTVCYTGYGGYQPEQSFALRAEKYFKGGKVLGEKVDTVLILGATNDSWNNSPVGEVKYSDRTDEDLRACLPAFCSILEHIRSEAPKTEIINIVNVGLKNEISDGMREACAHYGVKCIFLSGLDLVDGHPTVTGMKQIKEQIENCI